MEVKKTSQTITQLSFLTPKDQMKKTLKRPKKEVGRSFKRMVTRSLTGLMMKVKKVLYLRTQNRRIKDQTLTTSGMV